MPLTLSHGRVGTLVRRLDLMIKRLRYLLYMVWNW